MFGPDPLTMVCTNCQAQITTGTDKTTQTAQTSSQTQAQAGTCISTKLFQQQHTRLGVFAWVAAGLMCAFGQYTYICPLPLPLPLLVHCIMRTISGLWCCTPIPLCMDSLRVSLIIQVLFSELINLAQDVTHRCPSCNCIVGRYKAKM